MSVLTSVPWWAASATLFALLMAYVVDADDPVAPPTCSMRLSVEAARAHCKKESVERVDDMKWMTLVWLTVIAACAGGPQVGYESAPDAMMQADATDPGEAQALEKAETDCARQGKHAVSQRVEGETIYDCSDGN